MKIRIYHKDGKQVCTANLRTWDAVVLANQGRVSILEGKPAMTWESFTLYLEEAFEREGGSENA